MKLKLRSVGFILAIILIIFMSLFIILNFIVFIKFLANQYYYPDKLSDNRIFILLWGGFKLAPNWVDQWFYNPYDSSLDLTKFSIFYNIFISIVYIFTLIIFCNSVFRNKSYFLNYLASIIFIFFLPYGFLIAPFLVIINLIFYFNPVNLNQEFRQRVHDSFTNKNKIKK